jgi:diguanylate cyclase (GGDEF)-like protein
MTVFWIRRDLNAIRQLMTLFTIENLSLAAELTVVLLLLAFAWPGGKKSEQNDEMGSAENTSWEPAKLAYLHSCLYRGLYHQQWICHSRIANASATSIRPPFEIPSANPDDHACTDCLPVPWQDALTLTHNRTAFDTILNAWHTIPSEHRGKSCVSMLVISNYSDIVTTHGAMTIECALREVSKNLKRQLPSNQIIARYQPDRFAILHFASSLAHCHNQLSALQTRLNEKEFFQVADKPIPISTVVSIVELTADDSPESNLFEDLESGYLYAEEHGTPLVSNFHGTWTDNVEDIDHLSSNSSTVPPSQATESLDGAANNKQWNGNLGQDGQRTPGASSETADTIPHADNASQTVQDDSPAPSSDISAVASPDDIAALFAQINSKKAAEKPTQASESKPAEPKPAEPVNLQDAASADDIASLFASMKPASPTPAPSNPASAESKPAEPKPSEPVNLQDAASADDIASLFASMKPASPTPAPSPTTSPAKETPTNSQTPAACAQNIDLHEAASADDIASLFASIKPPTKTDPPKPSIEETSSAAPLPMDSQPAVAPAVAPLDLSQVNRAETASADDIASLFASIKPSAVAAPKANAAVPVEPPASTPAPSPSQVTESLDEPATADDIAALFQTVQSAIKPTKETSLESASTTQPTAPNPASIEAKPSPTVTTVNPDEHASADDIEALFAAMKK